jgi:hypothetical protein
MRITNSTEGGARIPNIEWKSLKTWASTETKSTDLFDRIKELRDRFKPGVLTAKSMKDFLSDFSVRWKKVIALIDSLADANLSTQVRADTFNNLRASEKQLLEDVRYITIVIQNAGREYLELVNELEVLEVADKNSSKEFQLKVENLYRLIDDVTSKLSACF